MSFMDENGVYFENYGGPSFQDSSGSQIGQNSQWNGFTYTQMDFQPPNNPCQCDNNAPSNLPMHGYNAPMPPPGLWSPPPQEVYMPQETYPPNGFNHRVNPSVNPPVLPPQINPPVLPTQINPPMVTQTVQQEFYPKKSTGKKMKRHRTAFTTNQITKLEEEYSRTRYVDRMRRVELSKILRLTDRSIKVWFQNRRMKEKKERAESPEVSVTSSYINLT